MNAPVLVVDLEATCSEDMAAGWEMETAEIGAVWVRGNGTVLDHFQSFVRPVVNPQLTAFFTNLTGISQSDVDDAPLFTVAAEQLRQFVERYQMPGSIWVSWGAWDARQLLRDSARYRIAEPIALPHQNGKRLFAKAQKIGKEVGMAKACQLAGQTIAGTHHRALDDAMSIVGLLPFVFGEKLLRAQHQANHSAP
ncbi:3'-5' exonuclease [Cupriavidus metallidurans]|uniref:3'-5' Exonuclease n=1 Tax=Cupriavidus metallidurans (strain ATCC 43123 / DSM 2839 / NBRC 102507 / CH34) TaxID=266264 RepID=Q1LJF7_CUPMC|nr:3'-5' exonuclease [Cupriavidus metallidurans]ABF09719.1 3'-5' Exonuclease [Cupriavidus metallidurans CH34]QGS29446.1 3'-5' exonuclease [Cupriavidus metallidurans]